MKLSPTRLVIRLYLLALACLAPQAFAQDTKSLMIVADILPVQALVTAVTGDIHTISLIIEPQDSAHDYGLRPSDARLLVNADIVFHIGDALTPWLGNILKGIAPRALSAPLLELPDDHDNDHGDPHAWLDPQQAMAWLARIRDELSQLDPENQKRYSKNAGAAISAIEHGMQAIEERSDDLSQRQWLNYHDNLSWFSSRFDIHPIDVVTDTEDAPPSAAHLASVRAHVAEGRANCVLVEQSVSPRAIAALDESDSLKTIAIDPLGVDLPLDRTYYPTLMSAIVDAIDACT